MSTNNKNPAEKRGNPTSVSMRVREIVDIAQSTSGFKLHPPPKETDNKLVAKVNAPAVEYEHIGEDLFVSLSLSFTGFLRSDIDESAEHPLIDIHAVFILHYLLDNDTPVDPVDLEAFAEINGLFNATPFWREYILDSLSRSKMPAYYLSPFNVAKILEQRNSEI